MKRLLFLSVLLMSVVICGTAFAAGPKEGKNFTFVGKLQEDGMVYIIQDPKNEATFEISSIKDATPEFRQCIDNGKYKNTVEITAKVFSINNFGSVIQIDKSSTCKRR